jgi:hypothetical protein
MPETTSFEIHFCFTTEYVESNSVDEDLNENIKAGDTFTMNYTDVKNYISADAASNITIVSIGNYFEVWWPDRVLVLDCVVKTDKPIYICQRGTSLSGPISLYDGTSKVATGYVSKLIGREPLHIELKDVYINLYEAINFMDTLTKSELINLSREDVAFIVKDMDYDDSITFVYLRNVKILGGVNEYITDYLKYFESRATNIFKNSGQMKLLDIMVNDPKISEENKRKVEEAIIRVDTNISPEA